MFPKCYMWDKFPFVSLVYNVFPISRKDSKCWLGASVLQLRWHFLVGHFTVAYRDLIVLCHQMWHSSFLVGGKSVAGLLSGAFLLKNLMWGVRDPLWLCVDCSCTDIGAFRDQSYLPSHQACQYFLSTRSVQGRKYSYTFRRSISKSESITCQIFPMPDTRIDPMESSGVLCGKTQHNEI